MPDTKGLPDEIDVLLTELETQTGVVEGSFADLKGGASANAAIVVESLHDLGDDVIKVRESLPSFPDFEQHTHQQAQE